MVWGITISFFLGQKYNVTEFIIDHRNSISFTKVSCDIYISMKRPSFVTTKLICYLSAESLLMFGSFLISCTRRLTFSHLSFQIIQCESLKVFWISEGLDPGENISKRSRTSFPPIRNEYIYWSFCWEMCQNKHFLDLFLSKNCFFCIRSFVKCIPSILK